MTTPTVKPRPRVPDVLTVPQVAAYLSIGRRQAYELVKTERLGVLIGRSVRVPRRRLERWLEEQ